MSAAVLPIRTAVAVYLLLLVLTAITVGAAFLDLWVLNAPIAVAIASAKALLVMMYFMELRHSSRLMWVVVGAGVFWLAVLILITESDILSRGWLGVPGR